MPAAAKMGDMTAGHAAGPPTAFIAGSANVMINGAGAVRVGDAATPHTVPPNPPHPTVASGGSGTVLVNGIPLARQGDPMSCGDTIGVTGNTVIVGG